MDIQILICVGDRDVNEYGKVKWENLHTKSMLITGENIDRMEKETERQVKNNLTEAIANYAAENLICD